MLRHETKKSFYLKYINPPAEFIIPHRSTVRYTNANMYFKHVHDTVSHVTGGPFSYSNEKRSSRSIPNLVSVVMFLCTDKVRYQVYIQGYSSLIWLNVWKLEFSLANRKVGHLVTGLGNHIYSPCLSAQYSSFPKGGQNWQYRQRQFSSLYSTTTLCTRCFWLCMLCRLNLFFSTAFSIEK